jgi:hypothetical protein
MSRWSDNTVGGESRARSCPSEERPYYAMQADRTLMWTLLPACHVARVTMVKGKA